MTTTPPYPDDNDPNRPYYNPGPPSNFYQTPNQPPQNNRGMSGKVWAFIAGGVVLLIAIIVAIVLLTNNSNDPAPVTPTTQPVTAVPPVSTAPTTVATTEPPTTSTTVPGGGSNFSPRPNANDDRFLQALKIKDDNGTDHADFWSSRIDNNRQAVLTLGYTICSAYDQLGYSDQSTQTILDALVKDPNTGNPTGIPEVEARWVRAAAVVTLCPEYKAN